MSAQAESLLLCSFCTKSQLEVAELIAGPGVHICDEGTAGSPLDCGSDRDASSHDAHNIDRAPLTCPREP